MKKFLLLSLCIVFTFSHATIVNVPSQYTAIQTAIDAAVHGDTILVAPGTYYENINFNGKNVFLTSMYYINNDTSYITSTVINGSTPQHPDTASCVLIVSGEDSTAVLQGFTITGGAGTAWTDIHNFNIYREGGGILIELSSPTIKNNIIINNHVTNTVGVSSVGGGGIRMGDSNPIVQNNIIMYNEGIYGPGIVMNYSGGTIRNNIIAGNYGGGNYYGGSGLWINGNMGTTVRVIENNTIIKNSAAAGNGTGGIFLWGSGNIIIRNNIIRDNVPALQIKSLSATPQISYNITSGIVSGTANILTDAMLDPLCNIPASGSAAIDAGDSSSVYNDITASPGVAQFPSQGSERNDIGATGGPYAAILNCIEAITSVSEYNNNLQLKVYPAPASDYIYIGNLKNTATITFCDLKGSVVKTVFLEHGQKQINVKDIVNGMYILKAVANGEVYNAKILIQH